MARRNDDRELEHAHPDQGIEHAHPGGDHRHTHEEESMTRGAGRGTARREEAGRTVELREEELQARKESVQAGEVEIRKDVVSEQRTMEVPVTREEVEIERRPADRRPADRPIGEDESISVPVREEQVTVEKRPVVREELEVGKRQIQDTEQVSGTVRREVADIDREGRIDVDEERRERRP
jgi:uncharacterized protein (TIGR02271 family)